MRVYEFLHWYYSHKLWCKLYLYLSHLLNQFFKFRFILYKRIWSILPICSRTTNCYQLNSFRSHLLIHSSFHFNQMTSIIPNQVELIHANFLISMLTRTNDIVLRIGRSLTDLPALCTDTVVLYQCCSVSSHQMGGFPSSNVGMTDHSVPSQSSSSTGI